MQQNQTNQTQKQRPIKKIRAGAISANVWRNTAMKGTQKMEFYSITVERNYKNKQDQWASTNSFRQNDLPKVQLVLAQAYEFLTLNKDESIPEVENIY